MCIATIFMYVYDSTIHVTSKIYNIIIMLAVEIFKTTFTKTNTHVCERAHIYISALL